MEQLVASQLHGLLGRQQHMRLAETSGQLLMDQTCEEAVQTMSHELAHGIACHGVEDSSWATTVSLMAIARLLWAGYGYFSSASITLLLGGLTWRFVTKTSLSQQHEYEADAMGAVIQGSRLQLRQHSDCYAAPPWRSGPITVLARQRLF